MIGFELTRDEALLLARLVGHHVLGDGLGKVYDQLATKLGVDDMVGPGDPFVCTGKNEWYGDRPMVRVDG